MTTAQVVIFAIINFFVWLLSWELKYLYFKVRKKIKKKLFLKRLNKDVNYHQQLADVIIEREPYFEWN